MTVDIVEDYADSIRLRSSINVMMRVTDVTVVGKPINSTSNFILDSMYRI